VKLWRCFLYFNWVKKQQWFN